MRKIRILTALAALSLAGGLTAAAVPAANAVTSHLAMSAHADLPAVPAGCTYKLADPVKWTVNSHNISIRYTPAGRAHYSISKNAGFDSDVTYHGFPVVCVNRHQSGHVRYWIYGYANAHTSHSGWVGCNYLNGDGTTCVAYLRARGLR